MRNHDGKKVASDVEPDMKEKLSEFVQCFNFPDLMGALLDYFKLDISLLFLKSPHWITKLNLISAKKGFFLQGWAANCKRKQKEKTALWWKDK